jgi:dipeptidase E
MTDVLLLSNSRAPGRAFLEHALGAIAEILHGHRQLLFIPFASSQPDHYTELMRDCLAPIDVRVQGAHGDADIHRAIAEAETVFVGGGNTFRLLKRLRDLDALGELRERALGGMPYLGVSAGANLAGPTIRTTNDMPIVEPGSFEALGLIPFQVNPHYPQAQAADPPGSETRQQRIGEFTEENDVPVLGLPEGTWLRVSAGVARLGGSIDCRLFRQGAEPEVLRAGSDVSRLLDLPVRFDTSERAGEPAAGQTARTDPGR